MEAITLAAGGIVIYCGWITVQDEMKCWRNYRASRRKKTESKADWSKGCFPCQMMTSAVSRP
jgi:hypothetical protein